MMDLFLLRHKINYYISTKNKNYILEENNLFQFNQ